MYRIYAIVGVCVLALTIIIALTTCVITEPPVGNEPAQHTQ
jgi:hypothetical protein